MPFTKQRRRVASMVCSAVAVAAPVVTLGSVGDAVASTVVASIPVGTNPTAIAINPAGTFAYVANVNADSVSEIDLGTGTVTMTIAVGSSPTAIAVNPSGTFAYVVNQNGHSVSKINLATRSTTTIPLGAGTVPMDIAIRPDGAFAYVAVSASDVVKKIDLATDTVVASISVGPYPHRIAITPSGTSLIVAGGTGGGPGEVDIVDTATDALVARVAVSEGWLSGVAVAPSGDVAYATGFGTNSIYRIDIATHAVDSVIRCACNPVSAVAFRPQGDFAFVGVGTGLAKLDVNASVIAAADVPVSGTQVDSVAITPDGRYGYVANRMLNTVAKVDLLSKLDQSISVPAPSRVPVTGGAEAIAARATSGLPVALSSDTPAVCSVLGQTVAYVGAGVCTLRAEQPGDASTWDAAPSATRSFSVYLSPPSGEPGISINGANPYTNDANVTLAVVWPLFAASVRLSNDGGFTGATTVTRDLATSYVWALDTSIKALHTKIVYMRFSGLGIDDSKTYTDDIVLDLTPPEIVTATARTIGGVTKKSLREMTVKKKPRKVVTPTIRVQVAAKDRLSGLEMIQVTDRKAAPGLARDYATITKIRTQKKNVFVRVQDGAGNWSSWEAARVR